MNWRGAMVPGGLYYLLALGAFVAVFALIPSTLYLHAGEEWHFRPYLLLRLFGVGLALFAVTAVLIRIAAVWTAVAARAIAALLFCLGAFAVFAHVYAPVALGPMDGSELRSDEPLAYTIVEALGVLLLLAGLLALVRGRGLRVAVGFAVLLLVVSAGYGIAAALAGRSLEPRTAAPAPGPAADRGNVYHIVLDTLQTDAVLAVLERRPELRDRLAGFQLFRHNIANYVSTRASAASYFTSTMYGGERYPAWLRAWQKRGLLADLDRAGYALWMYAPFPDWRSELIDVFRYNIDIYEAAFGFAGTAFYDFLHVWLVSLVPNPLTNEAIGPAASLRDQLFHWLAGRAKPLSVRRGIHPYAGVLMLRELTRSEAQRPPQGQYVYAHAALPHGPFVMDRTCRYVGKPERWRPSAEERLRAYLDQADCALRLLDDFLTRLEELGRYETAAIVVHADTGHGVGFLSDPDGAALHRETLGFADHHLLSSVNAALLVKAPHAEGPLRVREAPTQLLDVYPTLAELAGVAPPAVEGAGRPVSALGDAEAREARFGLKHGPGIVEVRILNQKDLEHSGLRVLGPAGEGHAGRRQAPR